MSNEHELLELEPNTSLTNRTRTEHPKSSVRFVKLIGRKILFELVFGKLTGRAYRTRTRTEPSELTEQFGSFTALLVKIAFYENLIQSYEYQVFATCEKNTRVVEIVFYENLIQNYEYQVFAQ